MERLVASLRLTPIELINKRFPKAVGGYSGTAVDEFLREISADYEEIVAENARLQERVGELQRDLDRFRAMETTLRDTLVLAQRTSDDVKAAARREAEQTVREAQSRAAALEEEARHAIAQVTQQRARFGREFRALLEGYLGELDAEAAQHRPGLSSDAAEGDTNVSGGPPLPGAAAKQPDAQR